MIWQLDELRVRCAGAPHLGGSTPPQSGSFTGDVTVWLSLKNRWILSLESSAVNHSGLYARGSAGQQGLERTLVRCMVRYGMHYATRRG